MGSTCVESHSHLGQSQGGGWRLCCLLLVLETLLRVPRNGQWLVFRLQCRLTCRDSALQLLSSLYNAAGGISQSYWIVAKAGEVVNKTIITDKLTDAARLETVKTVA